MAEGEEKAVAGMAGGRGWFPPKDKPGALSSGKFCAGCSTPRLLPRVIQGILELCGREARLAHYG